MSITPRSPDFNSQGEAQNMGHFSVETSDLPGSTLSGNQQLGKPKASGVIMAVGSHFAGFSLFLEEGRPVFVYARSTHPDHIYRIAAAEPFAEGQTNLRLRFDAEGPGKEAQVSIHAGKTVLASGHVANTFYLPSGLTETLDVGRDIGVPVTDYITPHGNFEGDVRRVSIRFDR
jgi:hypothetical protein